MITRNILVVLAVVSFSITAARAEDFIHAGSWEITLGAGGNANKDVENGTASLDGSVGLFLAKPLELGVRQSANYNDTSFGSAWSGSTRVFLDFQFNFGRIAPFVGANLGYVYGDGVVDTFEAAPEAGIKWYITKEGEAFLYGRVEYQFFFQDSDNAADNFDDGQFIFSLGVGFRL